MTRQLPPSVQQDEPAAPHFKAGALITVGYNAWYKEYKSEALDRMMDALADNGVDILVDTRGSDKKSRYTYQQLAEAAGEHTGNDGKPMRFTPRPALSGMPREDHEFTADGRADYEAMDERPEARKILDGMAASIKEGKRVAVLCACEDMCACHRTRWLAETLYDRGVVAQHLEPGSWRDRSEEVSKVDWHLSSHDELRGQLPHYSDTNWRDRMAEWGEKPVRAANSPSAHYQSPTSSRTIPEEPEVVLIAGSMNANPAQLNYASDLVVRAAELGAQIRVGDNDKGVDTRVVETANSIGYSNVQVWTADKEPRNGGVEGGEVIRVPYSRFQGGNQWTQRDRAMISSMPEENGICMFLSNGQTHYQNGRMSGTEAGYVYAVEQEKPAVKMAFNQSRHRHATLKPLPTTYTPPDYIGALHAADLDLNLPPQMFSEQPEIHPLDLGSDDDAQLKSLRQQPREAGWTYAAAQSEARTQEREKQGGRTTLHGADTFALDTVPIIGETEQLGYAVVGVQCHWRDTKFALPTHDWSTADTVKAVGIAHFHDQTVAREYEHALRHFMEDHQLSSDPVKATGFAAQVGEINRLPASGNTVTLIENNVAGVPQHHQQISALQAGLWGLPVEADYLFKPLDQPLPETHQFEAERLVLDADPGLNARQMKLGAPTYYFCVDEQGLSAQKVWAEAGQKHIDQFPILQDDDRQAAEQEASYLAQEGRAEGLEFAMKLAADSAVQRGLLSGDQLTLFAGPADPFKTEAQARLEHHTAIQSRRELDGERDEPLPEVAGSKALTDELAALATTPYEPAPVRRLFPSNIPYAVAGLASVVDADDEAHPRFSGNAPHRLYEETLNGVTYGLEVRQVQVTNEHGQFTDQYSTLDLTKEWDKGLLNFHVDPNLVQDGDNRLALKLYQAQTGIDQVRHAESIPLEEFGDISTPEEKKAARQAQRHYLERMRAGVPAETPDERLKMNVPFEVFEDGIEAIQAGQQVAERWQKEGLSNIMQHTAERVSPHLYLSATGIEIEQGRLFAYGPPDPAVQFDLAALPQDTLSYHQAGIYHPDRDQYLMTGEPDYALQVRRVPQVDAEGQADGLRYDLLAQKRWLEAAGTPLQTEEIILHSFRDQPSAFEAVSQMQTDWQQHGLETALDQALVRYCPPGATPIPAGELFHAGPRDQFNVPEDAALLRREWQVQQEIPDTHEHQAPEEDFWASLAREAEEAQKIHKTRVNHLYAIAALGINPEPFNPLSPDAELPAIQEGDISAWVTFYQPDPKEDYAIAGILTTYPDEQGRIRAAIAPCVDGERERAMMASGQLVELAHQSKNMDHFFCAAADMEKLTPQARVQWDSDWGHRVPVQEVEKGYEIEWGR